MKRKLVGLCCFSCLLIAIIVAVVVVTLQTTELTTMAPTGAATEIQRPATMAPTLSPSPQTSQRPPTLPQPTASPITAEPSQSPLISRPTFSPTESFPTASPTAAPSVSAPTTSPSLAPTAAPTTAPSPPTFSQPTSSPSLAPVTSSPTLSPTLAPITSSPTLSPYVCIPGEVTCCLNIIRTTVAIFVDEVNITDRINITFQNSASQSVTFTFDEPDNDAVIAIKGLEELDVLTASMVMACTCTREGSPWDGLTTELESSLWRAMTTKSGVAFNVDEFDPDWNWNNGTRGISPTESADTATIGTFNALQAQCPGTADATYFKHHQAFSNPRKTHFVFARLVSTNCTIID